MNRRNFFKFIAKGAAIVGVAGVFGLPEVEAKEWKFNVPKYDKNAVFNGSFSGWCIMGETVDGATIKEMYEKAKSLFFELPPLMPRWEEPKAKSYELRYDYYAWEAVILDKDENVIKGYYLTDYIRLGAIEFANVLRQDYIKYGVEKLKVWADDIEQYNYFEGLNELISNS